MAVDDDAALKAAVGLLEARRDRLARLRHDPELFHTLMKQTTALIMPERDHDRA
ncbi:MAG: hypothetical protein V3S87_12620 [Alphaproteobacteria bacterium]